MSQDRTLKPLENGGKQFRPDFDLRAYMKFSVPHLMIYRRFRRAKGAMMRLLADIWRCPTGKKWWF